MVRRVCGTASKPIGRPFQAHLDIPRSHLSGKSRSFSFFFDCFFFHSSVGSFLCVCVFSFNQSNQSDQSRHRQWTAVDQLGVPGRWSARPIGFVRIDSIGIRRSFHEIPLATDSTGLTGSIRSAFDWTLMSFFFSHSLIDSTSRLTRLSQFGSI